MRSIALPALLLPIGAALSCVGPGHLKQGDLTPQEQAVHVFYPGETPNCVYQDRGIVEGSSGTPVSMGDLTSSAARLQREAAARGATGVIVLDHSKNGVVDSVTGRAILCYAPLPAAYPPPYGAPNYYPNAPPNPPQTPPAPAQPEPTPLIPPGTW